LNRPLWNKLFVRIITAWPENYTFVASQAVIFITLSVLRSKLKRDARHSLSPVRSGTSECIPAQTYLSASKESPALQS
jgi:hypothetical protein